MEFVEAPAFTRHVDAYLDAGQLLALQLFLMEEPEAGKVMPGTGGFRKLRWGDQLRGKGKRGGLRVIYYWLSDWQQIWLFTLYGKDDAADLTTQQKKQLRTAITAELNARRQPKVRRGRRSP